MDKIRQRLACILFVCLVSLSTVKAVAQATYSNSSPQSLSVCAVSSANNINSLLTVNDVTNRKTETWSINTNARNGSLGGFPKSVVKIAGSTSSTPTGLTYTPASGYSGLDSFIISVTDGTNPTATMKVIVIVGITNPNNAMVCSGGDTSFSIIASGTVSSYQWQSSTNGGISFSNLTSGSIYSNVNSSTLNLTGVSSSYNNNVYKCVVNGSCGSITSKQVKLTLATAASITVNPSSSSICNGSNTSFGVTATGTGLTYQWQASDDGGTSYNNLSDGPFFINTASQTLNVVNAPPPSFSGYMFRCVITGTCNTVTSSAATLTVNATTAITSNPISTSVCAGTSASFGITATGGGLTYQWYYSPNGGSNYYILNSTGIYSNTSTDTVILTSPTTTQNGYLFACRVTGTCGTAVTSSAATLTTTKCINYWTGANSTAWDDPNNWVFGIPSNTQDGIISAGPKNQPIAGGNRAVKNLIIEKGAILTNNVLLDVYGNFLDSGTFISGPGSNVILLGTSGTISGSNTFANLEIQGNYSVGTSAADSIYVTGTLKKTSGTLTTNNKLTLVSNASGSAMIQENGGSLSGKAYIQHYAAGNFGYHHFSSPIIEGTVASWSNSFPLNGIPDSTVGAWTSSWGTLQYYNEAKCTASVLDSGYYNYVNPSYPLVPGRGYTAWLNILPTLNTFGTPNNGVISIPVTHTTGNSVTKGWNFVGNPYPSPISWTALKALNSSLIGDASCYLWQASGVGTNGTWTSFNGTVSNNSTGAGDIINSSLGFFVYVSKSGTLNFNNTVRNYGYSSPEIFGTKSVAVNTLRLSIKDTIGGTNDEIVAYTSNQASFSRKLEQPVTATNATIAFDLNGTKAAINVLTGIDINTVLPITILTPNAGTYTLNLNTKNIYLPVYLKDLVTGTYTDLTNNQSATVTTTSKETAGRYSLVFGKPASSNSNYELATFVYPNPAKGSTTISGNHIALIKVLDNMGRMIKVVSLKDATNPILSLSGIPIGVYHLRVQTTDGKVGGSNLVISY